MGLFGGGIIVGFFRPDWKSEDSAKAVKAIEALQNQKDINKAGEWFVKKHNLSFKHREACLKAVILKLEDPHEVLNMNKAGIFTLYELVNDRLYELAQTTGDCSVVARQFENMIRSDRTLSNKFILKYAQLLKKHPQYIQPYAHNLKENLRKSHYDMRAPHSDTRSYSRYASSDCHDDVGIHVDNRLSKNHTDRRPGEDILRMFFPAFHRND